MWNDSLLLVKKGEKMFPFYHFGNTAIESWNVMLSTYGWLLWIFGQGFFIATVIFTQGKVRSCLVGLGIIEVGFVLSVFGMYGLTVLTILLISGVVGAILYIRVVKRRNNRLLIPV